MLGATLALIEAGYARMVAAEQGEGDGLEADIAFHLAILRASGNPFFMQFRDLVATAVRTSIRLTNRIAGRTADLAAQWVDAIHRAIADAGPNDPEICEAMGMVLSEMARGMVR